MSSIIGKWYAKSNIPENWCGVDFFVSLQFTFFEDGTYEYSDTDCCSAKGRYTVTSNEVICTGEMHNGSPDERKLAIEEDTLISAGSRETFVYKKINEQHD